VGFLKGEFSSFCENYFKKKAEFVTISCFMKKKIA
jgi:hypothetical protein